MWILGLKGLSVGLHPTGHRVQWHLATLSLGFFFPYKIGCSQFVRECPGNE